MLEKSSKSENIHFFGDHLRDKDGHAALDAFQRNARRMKNLNGEGIDIDLEDQEFQDNLDDFTQSDE